MARSALSLQPTQSEEAQIKSLLRIRQAIQELASGLGPCSVHSM